MLAIDYCNTKNSPDYFTDKDGCILRTLRPELPHRSDYYVLSVCFGGEATLSINLDSYHIKPGTLIAFTPEQIKQWRNISPDFLNIAVLFKKNYLLANSADPNLLDSFPFFHFENSPLCSFDVRKTELLGDCMRNIREATFLEHTHKDEVIRSLIHVLLYNAVGVYEEGRVLSTHHPTRQTVIFSQFQHLVSKHVKTERALPFYATQLHITPKHLSETIKEVSGKTARQWINEVITLEAKVLLQNLQLSVGQIAESLNYPDQSSFGKFFKTHAGCSPSQFRSELR